jgi:hypothetical protein
MREDATAGFSQPSRECKSGISQRGSIVIGLERELEP